MQFDNVYEDSRRAEAYAKLEFPGTYYLAYRDIPEIISRHATGHCALDFGCGTGRSTRFLKGLGFETIGVDISEDMLTLARAKDPHGDYLLVGDSPRDLLGQQRFDIILAAFTFDNVAIRGQKVSLFQQLGGLLTDSGRLINLVSSPDIYTHEWASFTTRDFPENRLAASGDRVKIIMTDVDDRRPVEDVLWTDASYREVYNEAGISIESVYMPLGKESEPIAWVNETSIAPWAIYVLKNTR